MSDEYEEIGPPRELPQLQQVELGDALLEALVLDLTELTDIQLVIPKAAAGYIVPQVLPLSEGVQLLREGDLRGLQIRYLYEGDEWWDTLMNTGKGIRLTRIKQEY